MNPVTLGLIIGNRGFFPSHLCETGREAMLQVLDEAGFNVIVLDAGETAAAGSIESIDEARKVLNSSTPIATRSTVCWSRSPTLAMNAPLPTPSAGRA